MAAAERFWLCQIIWGVDIGRHRPDEFMAKAETVGDLEQLMDEAGRTTREMLSDMTTEQLHETRDARG